MTNPQVKRVSVFINSIYGDVQLLDPDTRQTIRCISYKQISDLVNHELGGAHPPLIMSIGPQGEAVLQVLDVKALNVTYDCFCLLDNGWEQITNAFKKKPPVGPLADSNNAIAAELWLDDGRQRVTLCTPNAANTLVAIAYKDIRDAFMAKPNWDAPVCIHEYIERSLLAVKHKGSSVNHYKYYSLSTNDWASLRAQFDPLAEVSDLKPVSVRLPTMTLSAIQRTIQGDVLISNPNPAGLDILYLTGKQWKELTTYHATHTGDKLVCLVDQLKDDPDSVVITCTRVYPSPPPVTHDREADEKARYMYVHHLGQRMLGNPPQDNHHSYTIPKMAYKHVAND